jgi:hypothetical protein
MDLHLNDMLQVLVSATNRVKQLVKNNAPANRG